MYANRQIVKYISRYVKRIRFISEEGAVPPKRSMYRR